MIDFRYHVVSLVSVFLALAVGIVLGAGPLKGSIGDTLTSQVDALRQDRDLERAQLSTSQTAVTHRDEVLRAVTPALVTGQLRGRSVLLVRLPGVDSAVIEPLTTALAASGAAVTGQVEVQPAWTDPGKQSFRDELATRLQASSPVDGDDSTAQLAARLARATLVRPGTPAGPADEADRTVLADLQDGKLISVEDDVSRRADEAVVLAPAVDEATTGQPSPSPSPSPSPAPGAYVDVVDALDGGSAGTVVLGPASSATDAGVLAAVRRDDAVSRRASTVDTGGTPMGDLTCVLALREQLGGDAGAYGFGEGASEPVPTTAGGQ